MRSKTQALILLSRSRRATRLQTFRQEVITSTRTLSDDDARHAPETHPTIRTGMRRAPSSARALSRMNARVLRQLSLVLIICLCVVGGCKRQAGDVVVKPADEKVRVGAFMSLTGDTAQ